MPYRDTLNQKKWIRAQRKICPICSEWMDYRSTLCRKCSQKKSRKTEHRHSAGYLLVYMPEHPRAHETGYIYQHILVAEKALGKHFRQGEIVHHIDGNPSNNHRKNLLICDRSFHRWLHHRLAILYMIEHFRRKK